MVEHVKLSDVEKKPSQEKEIQHLKDKVKRLNVIMIFFGIDLFLLTLIIFRVGGLI